MMTMMQPRGGKSQICRLGASYEGGWSSRPEMGAGFGMGLASRSGVALLLLSNLTIDRGGEGITLPMYLHHSPALREPNNA